MINDDFSDEFSKALLSLTDVLEPFGEQRVIMNDLVKLLMRLSHEDRLIVVRFMRMMDELVADAYDAGADDHD